MSKAKFIVIDGTDGSGKTTQWYLLAKKLREKKISYAMLNFPIYQSFFGQIVKRYLSGEFGDPVKTNPYINSLPYAFDRFFCKNKISQAIDSNKVILVNRYATSNLIHQGAKIKSKKEREKYFKWAEKLEYEILKLPKPDVVIYLWVPVEISFNLVKQREKKTGGKRIIDGHEKNFNYQKEVANVARNLAKTRRNWRMIECCKDGKLLSRQEIARKVWEIVKKLLKNRI